jgi:hypothetical protein
MEHPAHSPDFAQSGFGLLKEALGGEDFNVMRL